VNPSQDGSKPVLFGLNLTPVYPRELAEIAQTADAYGFESLWIGEHVLVPLDGVPEGDARNFRPDSRFVEPWSALSHVAAATRRVKLGTCVAVLPLHHPVHLARQIATVDVLSGGRVIVGAGIGVIEAEYRAVGEDFHSRGARLDEMIDVLDLLFTQKEPQYHGRYFDFPPSGFEPKPISQPRPPLLLGGGSPAALRRCVARADGWFGTSPDPDAARPIIADLQERREAAGHPPLEITLLTGWGRGYDPGLVEAYEEAGVDRLVATPWSSSRAARQGIEQFAADAGLVPAP
jgi:probable F420-dependent oxidoreductase